MVAHQGISALNLWDKFYKHPTGNRVDAYGCAAEVATPFLIIEDYSVGTRRTKHDDITPLTFTVGNATYLHDSSVYNYVKTEYYSLALIGHSDLGGATGNSALPLLILETTSSGLVISPVAPEGIFKRDGGGKLLFYFWTRICCDRVPV